MFRFAWAAVVAAAMAGPALAGEFNKKVSIGDAAPEFSKLEGVDGHARAPGRTAGLNAGTIAAGRVRLVGWIVSAPHATVRRTRDCSRRGYHHG